MKTSLFLYKHRHNPLTWLVFVTAGILLGTGCHFAIKYVLRQDPSNAWSFLLAVVAAPTAWLAWLIRDRNRIADAYYTARESARSDFNRLREWATSEIKTNPRLVNAALYDLTEFISPNSKRLPDILSREEKQNYQDAGRLFFREFLSYRDDWDNWTDPYDPKEFRGPIPATVMQIISQHGNLLGPMENANLSDFDLSRANLKSCKFRSTWFQNTQLRKANLACADLRNTNLKGAIFSSANLCGADLRGAAVDEKTDFTKAQADKFTAWPTDEFTPEKYNIQFVKVPQEAQ